MEKLIIANWKLNPETLSKAKKLALAEDYGNVVIAPPFLYLEALRGTLKSASLAAQDVFWEETGAYTGEISPSQLKDVGVEYVLVGHSERRGYFGETDSTVNKKVKAALSAGLRVILCVGEGLEIRKRGIESAKRFITDQLSIDLKGVQKKYSKNMIIAYEPIWAIGTGDSDIPEETAEISAYIKNLTGVVKVLYGGSVNSSNAAEFLKKKDIDGALVGGASLKSKEFQEIVAIE